MSGQSLTRKQEIAKLQEELGKLSALQLEEDIKEAKVRLDAAVNKYELAQHTHRCAREEYDEAHKVWTALEHPQAETKAAARPRIYTCSRHPLTTHPHNFSTEPGECPN